MAFGDFFNHPFFNQEGLGGINDWLQSQLSASQLRMNVEDHQDHYVITAELPGVHPENMSLKREGQSVVLRAKRDQFTQQGTYTSRVSSVVPIPPDGLIDTISANYQHGILSLQVEKGELQEVNSEIPIKFGD